MDDAQPSPRVQHVSSAVEGGRATVRYEVNSGSLVNLNELALAERRPEKFVLDVQHSF
jgi:hypothetical protein